MNVVADRLVEKLVHQELQEEAAETDRSILLPKDQTDGAIQRAKDIEDKEWLVLLSPEHKTDNDMLQIALGYFSSAARIHLHSEMPPMWKKVWDTWTLLGDIEESNDDTTNVPPFEAQAAIDNLIRIANTKGNTKRTSELQQRLVQSYLNTDRINLTAITSKTRKKEAPKLILECFGGSASVGSSSDLVKMTDRAVSTLKECQSYFEKQISDAELWIPDCLLYQTLWVQSLVMQQATIIQSDAHKMYALSQSRAPGKTTLGDCIKKCRESFLVMNVVSSTDPFQFFCFYLHQLHCATQGLQFGERMMSCKMARPMQCLKRIYAAIGSKKVPYGSESAPILSATRQKPISDLENRTGLYSSGDQRNGESNCFKFTGAVVATRT
jgi:hypothetical protein